MQFTVSEYCISDSGAKGLIINAPGAEVVSMSWCFRAGFYYTGKYSQQLAHVLEHLIVGANSIYPTAETFDREFGRNGATKNAHTWSDNVTYTLECLKSDWHHALMMMRDSICCPALTYDRLQAELGNVRSEQSGYVTQTGRSLGQLLWRSMGSRLETDADSVSTLDGINLNMVEHYYAKVYTLDNMRFVIAGDFTDCMDKLQAELDGFYLSSGARMDEASDNKLHTDNYLVYGDDCSSVTYYNFRMLTEGRLSLDQLTNGAVLCRLLTGSMSSLLLGWVRHHGLAYGIKSDVDSLSRVGVTQISGRADAKMLPELFAQIVTVLKQLADGDLANDEVDEAKSFLLCRLPFETQTVGDLAQLYSNSYFNYNDQIVGPTETREMLQTVSKESVITFLHQFLQSNLWGIGFYGSLPRDKAAQILSQLSALLSH